MPRAQGDLLDAGIPCAYVLEDAVYGSDKSLRVMLERREQPHVLAVRSNERLMAGSFQTRRWKTERKESAPCRPPVVNRSPQLGVTVQAIGHLLARAVFVGPSPRRRIFQWTDWRIMHNAEARRAHYQSRQKPQL